MPLHTLSTAREASVWWWRASPSPPWSLEPALAARTGCLHVWWGWATGVALPSWTQGWPGARSPCSALHPATSGQSRARCIPTWPLQLEQASPPRKAPRCGALSWGPWSSGIPGKSCPQRGQIQASPGTSVCRHHQTQLAPSSSLEDSHGGQRGRLHPSFGLSVSAWPPPGVSAGAGGRVSARGLLGTQQEAGATCVGIPLLPPSARGALCSSGPEHPRRGCDKKQSRSPATVRPSNDLTRSPASPTPQARPSWPSSSSSTRTTSTSWAPRSGSPHSSSSILQEK